MSILKWFKQNRSSLVPVNGPIMKAKAEDFGKLFGKEFVCSNGWLD